MAGCKGRARSRKVGTRPAMCSQWRSWSTYHGCAFKYSSIVSNVHVRAAAEPTAGGCTAATGPASIRTSPPSSSGLAGPHMQVTPGKSRGLGSTPPKLLSICLRAWKKAFRRSNARCTDEPMGRSVTSTMRRSAAAAPAGVDDLDESFVLESAISSPLCTKPPSAS